MNQILKVPEDFYKKDIKEGDMVATFGGSYRILDLNYQNEFGTFILCEYIEKNADPNLDSKWTKREGVPADAANNFEIIGSIHIPDYQNIMTGLGYFVKNHELDEMLGLSYEQTWNLLFQEGARNAEASTSQFNNHRTKLIDTIDGLPSLDSHYWKIPAYNEEGVAFAPLTKEVLKNIERSIQSFINNLKNKDINKNKTSLSEETISEVKAISNLINQASKIVFLTGAGMSTNSGIPDYRSSVESMWRKNPSILDQLSQRTFENDPKDFWNAFYQLIRQTLSSLMPFQNHESLIAALNAISPNEGHRFITWLQKDLQKKVTVITQNVDGLDKKAGTEKVIEMHGNIRECLCPECNLRYPLEEVLIKEDFPACICGSTLRPNLVFFGDNVLHYEEAIEEMKSADLIIVAGTSLQVYPFNQLVHAKNSNAKLNLMNHTQVDYIVKFDHSAIGDISKISNELKKLLESKV